MRSLDRRVTELESQIIRRQSPAELALLADPWFVDGFAPRHDLDVEQLKKGGSYLQKLPTDVLRALYSELDEMEQIS